MVHISKSMIPNLPKFSHRISKSLRTCYYLYNIPETIKLLTLCHRQSNIHLKKRRKVTQNEANIGLSRRRSEWVTKLIYRYSSRWPAHTSSWSIMISSVYYTWNVSIGWISNPVLINCSQIKSDSWNVDTWCVSWIQY